MSCSRMVCFAVLLLVWATAKADTTWVVSGNVSGTWTSEHSPYMIQNSITIADTSELLIGPGVRVFFSNACGMNILGHFYASGTETDSVVFTSDTTDGIGWLGIVQSQAIPGDTVVMDHCVIENTRYHAGDPGNGRGFSALAANGVARLQSCAFRNCTAFTTGGLGGGFQASCDSCDVDLQDCEFANNRGGDGGGILVERTAMVNVRRCDLYDNHSLNGSAIYNSSSRAVSADSCIFHDNRSVFWGGALYLNGTASESVRHCTLYNNGAMIGGAILLSDGGCVVDHCLLYDNQGTTGGAIDVEGGTYDSLTNCTLVNNLSEGNGALQILNYTAVRNCIIAYNWGGVGIYGGSNRVRYCAVFGNELGEIHAVNVPGLGVIDTVNINGDSCDVFSNILLNPLFVDTTVRNFHLAESSPCINAGDPTAPLDPDSTIADMGAFFYQPPSGTDPGLVLHPSEFGVSSYPNPFNSTTTISFTLPRAGAVKINVYDVLGREVGATPCAPTRYSTGTHNIAFDGAALSSGVYFVRVEMGESVQTRKMLLLR
jgi:hypothetical protein